MRFVLLMILKQCLSFPLLYNVRTSSSLRSQKCFEDSLNTIVSSKLQQKAFLILSNVSF